MSDVDVAVLYREGEDPQQVSSMTYGGKPMIEIEPGRWRVGVSDTNQEKQ